MVFHFPFRTVKVSSTAQPYVLGIRLCILVIRHRITLLIELRAYSNQETKHSLAKSIFYAYFRTRKTYQMVRCLTFTLSAIFTLQRRHEAFMVGGTENVDRD